MYRKVSTELSFVDREKEVVDFWKKNDIFKKSIDNREGAKSFTFYDGPPTANGRPHIGHVLTRVIKDMIPRYRTMKGYQVQRKAGWDTHGLPVELEVEKLLGLDGKEQVEEYGLIPFVDKCKESVWKYKGMWEDFSATVGFWADMEHPYVTYHDDYIESEWWALKEIWNKKLLYKGFKIVPYCPRCGTPLSAQEVAQGYKDVKERSAIVRFKVRGEDAYILAWTTTPWTLPSNVALCVHPDETYAKVKSGEYTYYLAEALLDTVLGEGNYEILETYTGTDLEGKEYEPLYHFKPLDKKAYYVVCDTYVTLTDGTGVVHIAPAFGEDDSKVGRRYGLPFLQLVNEKGEMSEETAWPGVFVKKADPMVLEDLEKRGLLYAAPKFEHSYPHCWRCDTPLIYYARESWFIKMTAVKDDLIRNNNTINWIPESIGKGRFGDWLENVQDWGISRNRYWGTPLNIWECECGHMHSVGSRQELCEMSGDERAKTVELHRPYIDEITIKCPECGKEMHRVPEVIDCWFDSGAMPFAQHHYPFENKELFDRQFPADFISEAVDQTRGWFYSLLAESTLLFNKAPYKNVIVLGHVQDENGQKMSKSKGNAVDPFDALEKYGADAIRWYFYINSAPWLPNRFSAEAVLEYQRKFLGTLWNTYAFYVLYAEIDQFDPTKHRLDHSKLSAMDLWILSKLNGVIRRVDEYLDQYKITEAARLIQEFTDELSNWYVRRSRERFWTTGMSEDKISAYMTLYTVLTDFVKVCAPFIPFMTEQIYQNLVLSVDKNAPESVHLCDYPSARPEFDSPQIEEDMDAVRKVVMLGRACRNAANVKNRQPLAKIFIQAGKKMNEAYQSIILEELNVKEVVFTDNAAEFISYNFKPQLRTLGPKYGKILKAIFEQVNAMDGARVMDTLNSGELLKLNVQGTDVEIGKDDVLVETLQKDGFVSDSDMGFTVVLDTNLTPELVEEGFVREIISKIQTMRKDNGYEVQDHILVKYDAGQKIQDIITQNYAEIAEQTLADGIEPAEKNDSYKKWNVNGETVHFCLEKA